MELTKETEQKFNFFWENIKKKMFSECDRVGEQIPYTPVDGKYSDMGKSDISWWTNGFWPGILWQMYHATDDKEYKETAEKVENRLDKAFADFDGLHHDVGFMWLLSAVANYRMTGCEKSKTRGIHAATILAGRYNPKGKFIRAWNSDMTGWIIVDSMMNIPILHWASAITGDPRFAFIANDHADTLQKTIVRADGSCNHIVILNPENGEVLDIPAGQGSASGSSWSRGQAWAIYGFALSYRYTRNNEYLETAKKIAHYFIANITKTDFVPVIDFRAPAVPVKWDTTAGVCAACGLLEIADFVPENEKSLYYDGAVKILEKIGDSYCNWDVNHDSIVSHGSTAYFDKPGIHVPIIYGDYYFIEGILRVLKKDFHLW